MREENTVFIYVPFKDFILEANAIWGVCYLTNNLMKAILIEGLLVGWFYDITTLVGLFN